MKVAIEVKDRAEGHRIKTAIGDDTARALMNVVGALMPLSPRDQKRVLAFVTSSFEEAGAEQR